LASGRRSGRRCAGRVRREQATPRLTRVYTRTQARGLTRDTARGLSDGVHSRTRRASATSRAGAPAPTGPGTRWATRRTTAARSRASAAWGATAPMTGTGRTRRAPPRPVISPQLYSHVFAGCASIPQRLCPGDTCGAGEPDPHLCLPTLGSYSLAVTSNGA